MFGSILAILALAAGLGSCWAQAPQAVVDLDALPADQKAQFQEWVINRGKTLDIPFPFINMINTGMNGKSIRERIYALEEFISGDDFKVLKYMDLLEENVHHYKRINPYDRALLAAMKLYGIPRKQAFIDRFNSFTGGLGIEAKRLDLGQVGSDARAKPTGRRYNPESGLFEKYDPKKKEWIPQAQP